MVCGKVVLTWVWVMCNLANSGVSSSCESTISLEETGST